MSPDGKSLHRKIHLCPWAFSVRLSRVQTFTETKTVVSSYAFLILGNHGGCHLTSRIVPAVLERGFSPEDKEPLKNAAQNSSYLL